MSFLKPIIFWAMLGAGLGFVGAAVLAAGVHFCEPSATPVPPGGPLIVVGGWSVCGTVVGLVGGALLGLLIAVFAAVFGSPTGRRRSDQR